MTRRTVPAAAAEVVLWWAALTVLWLMLITTVDVLEVAVGASAALAGALVARAARRAAGRS